MTIETFLRGFISEPVGVLICAVGLIGGAVTLRWFFGWHEEITKKAQTIAQELLEKTVG